MRAILRLANLVAVVVLAAASMTGCTTTPRPTAPAAEQRAREVTRVEMGQQLYVKYCASCHGPSGRGDGPKAATLTPRPPDLTLIAKQHGGTFPWMLVYRIIDGQLSGRAHGFPDMPAWGNVFRDDAAMDINDRSAVEGRIMLLTSYLQSIQQK